MVAVLRVFHIPICCSVSGRAAMALITGKLFIIVSSYMPSTHRVLLYIYVAVGPKFLPSYMRGREHSIIIHY